jgi:hypothetical protein
LAADLGNTLWTKVGAHRTIQPPGHVRFDAGPSGADASRWSRTSCGSLGWWTGSSPSRSTA